MKYTEYLTIQGDRWDTVAFKAYGDATMVGFIIESNKEVYLTEIIPPGVRLLIPIIEVAENYTDPALLPPWKR